MGKVEWQLVPVEPTYQMCEAIGIKWESGPGFPTRYKTMLAAAPTPPAQEAEPVGAVTYENSAGYEVRKAYLFTNGAELPDGTLLYTHAPSDKLRQAAAELDEFIHNGMHFDEDAYTRKMIILVGKLRAELEGKS